MTELAEVVVGVRFGPKPNRLCSFSADQILTFSRRLQFIGPSLVDINIDYSQSPILGSSSV